MADDFTARYKVDISDLKKNLAEANRQIKLTNATFKAEVAGMDKWSASAEGLAAKLKQLKGNLEAQKSILKTYEEQLKRQTDAQEKNTKVVETLKNKIAELKKAEGDNSAQIKAYQDELKRARQELQRNETAANDLSIKVLEQKAAIGNTEKAIRGFETAQKNLENSTENLTDTINNQSDQLAKLKKKYADVVEAEGKDSDEAKKLARQIQNLSGDLDQNQAELKDSKTDTEKLSKAFDLAKGAAGNLGQKLATGLKKGLTVIAAGMATVAAGAVAAGKQALASYSDYEQLVGGVDTLFKENSKTVQEYAQNAYKAAGISANEYMETVTSFSASLIQSLGGDTEKAAELADMAIKDMSDNANKMGTDMSSIQNAYQGFAKQNYNMLDNLKLGYGGTQEEMYRLLSDAQAIDSSFDAVFSIDKKGHLTAQYSDIVKAIHIVQDEMGITGTTAKEAAETISGSISTMKGAWSNLLTGLADDNADFDKLVSSFTDSLINVINNVKPRIKSIISGLGKFVAEASKEIVPLIAEEVPNLISELLPVVAKGFETLITSVDFVKLGNAFATGLKSIDWKKVFGSIGKAVLSAFGSIFKLLGFEDIDTSKIKDSITSLFAPARDLAQTFKDMAEKILPVIVNDLLPAISTALTYIMDGITPIISAVTPIFEKVGKFAADLIEKLSPHLETIGDLIAKIIEKLEPFITPLFDTIMEIVDILNPAIEDLLDFMMSLVDFITPLLETLKPVADTVIKVFKDIAKIVKDVIDFFKGVLTGDWDTAWEGIKNIAKDAWEGIKHIFELAWNWITTPFRAVFEFFDDVWKKMQKPFTDVANWFKGIFEGAVSGIKAAFDGLGSFIKGVWDGIVNVVKTPINWIIDAINGIINGINSLSIDIPEWVPLVGGQHWGMNIPNIPRLARGGVIKSPTYLQAGERGAEAIVPLERNTQWIRAVANDLLSALSTAAKTTVNNQSSAVDNRREYSFTQNIYAPQQPSRYELYVQTQNLLELAKQAGGI